MDFSDSMMGIVKKSFPQAEIVIDHFHVIQLYTTRGLDAMRMKLKRTNTTEVKRGAGVQRRREAGQGKGTGTPRPMRSRRARTANSLGRPRKRKNEKFEPKKLSNGETKADLLTHVRYPLTKNHNDWTDFQKEEMRLLFEIEPKMEKCHTVCPAPCATSSARKRTGRVQRKRLHKWYKNVGRTRIREIISVRDTIKAKEEYVLNFFNNRSTNAPAESLNSKIKGLRAQVHGVSDLPFFMFRCFTIFG